MADRRNKFTQPNDDTPFRKHLKEVTKLNIGLPSFTGTFSTLVPEEERWKIKVWVPGRTFAPTTKPIDFYLDARSWSLGKSMATHITFGRICEMYHKELENTIYQLCGHRDEEWEMIRTRKDGLIAAYIQEMDQHIRRYENQMCSIMNKTKKLMKKKIKLEEELKSTRDGYEEEIVVLLEKHEDLKKKLGIPVMSQKREPEVEIRTEDYIILDDTDTDSDANDDSDDDYIDEAGADIMESSTDQNF